MPGRTKQIAPVDFMKAEIIEGFASGAISLEAATRALQKINRGQLPRGLPEAPDRPPKFWLYIRVSHQDQKVSHLSLDHQLLQGTRYFEYLRTRPDTATLEWGDKFVDAAVSAYNHRLIARRAGMRMNLALQRGDHVAFVRLDRGFRNTRDFLETYPLWESRGIHIHFMDLNVDTSTANGRFFATVAAAVSEWESAVKSERTRAALARLKAEGRPVNGVVPLGMRRIGNWDQRKRLIATSADRGMCRYILHLHFHHKQSTRKIADRIEALLAKREMRAEKDGIWERRTWGGMRVWRVIKRFLVEHETFCERVCLPKSYWPQRAQELLAHVQSKGSSSSSADQSMPFA